MFSSDGVSGMADDAGELVRRAGPQLDIDLQDIGCYVSSKSIAARATEGGSNETAVLITAVIGRVAFGDNVQRPEQVAVDDEFNGITDRWVDSEYARRRRELGDGGGPVD